MFSMLAVLAYLAGLAIPVFLLVHFGASHWWWHTLSILAALALGLAPLPGTMHGPVMDLAFGFVFIFLMTWGIGGVVTIRPHREKHA